MSMFVSHKECFECGELGHKKDMIKQRWQSAMAHGGDLVVYMHKKCCEEREKDIRIKRKGY